MAQPDKKTKDKQGATPATNGSAEDEVNHLELQPTLNIGTIGHVAHGKSTLTKALSGVVTGKHHEEKARNMTIKLGYANAKIWRCNNKQCPPPWCYTTTGSTPKKLPKCKRPQCGSDTTLVRHVSFVDSPGHHDLMATMLSGAAVMDGALLVVAANEPCPSPQTAEHLVAAEISGFAGNTVVIQNKLDLVTAYDALINKQQLDKFLEGTSVQGRPVVPVSAQLGFNMDVVAQYIVNHIEQPRRDLESPPRMVVVRSFDVNQPGCAIDNLSGGVVGGSLTRGILKVGQQVEIRPGLVGRDGSVTPVVTTVVSLRSEKTNLPSAVPGGLIAVGTELDPVLTKSDRLVGNMLGPAGSLPPVFREVKLEYRLMGRVVGAQGGDGGSKSDKVKIRAGDRLLYCLGSARVEGKVIDLKSSGKGATKKRMMAVKLDVPICAEPGAKAALFQNKSSYTKQWRLIGSGTMLSCTPLPLKTVEETSGFADDPAVAMSVQIRDDDEEEPSAQPDEEAKAEQASDDEAQDDTALVELSGDGYDPDDNHCNMHEGDLPEEGQIVMAKVERLDPQIGAYVSVQEYGGLDGLVVVRDISRKRIRSLKKEMRPGNIYAVRVTRVNERMKRVDLSKRDVEQEDAVKAEEWFIHTKLFHALMRRLSNTIKVPLPRVYEVLGWPLYRHYADLARQDGIDEDELHDPSYHPIHAFQELAQTAGTEIKTAADTPADGAADGAADDATEALAQTKVQGVKFIQSLGLPKSVFNALVKCVTHRLTLKPSKVVARVQVMCVQLAGVTSIKKALAAAIQHEAKEYASGAQHNLDEDETAPEITLTTPPQYELTMVARDTQSALKRIRNLSRAVEAAVRAVGGEMAVAVEAHVA